MHLKITRIPAAALWRGVRMESRRQRSPARCAVTAPLAPTRIRVRRPNDKVS